MNPTIINEFYMDIYKPLRVEVLNSIARYYLTLQIEENRVKKLNTKKYLNRFDDGLEENLTPKELNLLSRCMVDMHCTAREAYLSVYARNKTSSSGVFMPKPFTVSMFQQLSVYFLIYMKRIKEQESIKIEKFERAFRKFDEVAERVRGYDREREELLKKLSDLDRSLKGWDERIEKQKDSYRMAVDECKKEEKLVDEMGETLEKLKSEVIKKN
jgi:DNA-binding Lrp family transcriptional regulator